jgi:ribonuclease-3
MSTSRLVLALQVRLGYHFRSEKILLQALTHSSFLHDNRVEGEENRKDYEGLEFLGDAILGFLVSERLFRIFPNGTEGELSKIKAALVSREHLARAASRLGLGEFIMMSRGEESSGGRERRGLLADVFESLTAAIYLDGGLQASVKFVDLGLEEDFVSLGRDGFKRRDFKSILQETLHRLSGDSPRYRLVVEEGPPHRRRFVVSVSSPGGIVTEGEGGTKKAAEQEAARRALELLARTS